MIYDEAMNERYEEDTIGRDFKCHDCTVRDGEDMIRRDKEAMIGNSAKDQDRDTHL